MVNYKLKYILLFFLFSLTACDSRQKLEDIFNKSSSDTKKERSITVIYTVQGPDGRTYDIEGPAGASDEQVINAVEMYLLEKLVSKQIPDRHNIIVDRPTVFEINGKLMLCTKIGVINSCN